MHGLDAIISIGQLDTLRWLFYFLSIGIDLFFLAFLLRISK